MGLRALVLVWLLCCLFIAVKADFNVTVDDGDTALIIYEPPGSWQQTAFDALDSGGQHTVTSDEAATATFTFTGVAIYFWSPLWPFRMTTAISLDGTNSELVDLRDHSQPVVEGAPETSQSQVVWFRDGLDNTQHTLVISIGAGRNLAIVDGLQYTVFEDPSSSTLTSSSTLSMTSTSSSVISSPTAGSATASHPHTAKTGLSIALGLVCTIFGLLVIGGIYWYWRRRQRLREEEEYTSRDLPPPEMSDASNNGYAASRPSYYKRYRFVAPDVGRNRSAPRRKGFPRPAAAAVLKGKNPLTTIPEIAVREDGASEGSRRSHLSVSSPFLPEDAHDNPATPPWTEVGHASTSGSGAPREESWTYPQSDGFVRFS
ncbi:hypothetical protein BDZ97DRAFT_1916822 [Flammula alnicola]|nr:hypothetical protein BDZ97DRAFT_1916822 [Flammula alnicola]